MLTVHKWGVFEAEFKSGFNYSDPFRNVRLTCLFRSPSGREFSVNAFWDGSLTWRVRFMPDDIGLWSYRSESSNREDDGLHGQSGLFECLPYEGENPLYIHGPLRLSENRRFLIHSDGTPFFWLADTAWNGIIKSKEDEWKEYLSFRRDQGFSAVQFVMTHWHGGPCDFKGEKAYAGRERIIKLNVDFFKRIDPKFSMINEMGIVAAPVLLWAIKCPRFNINPGFNLIEEDAVLFARYLIARYGAHILVWILAGDGDYKGERSERWKRIGRAVFSNEPGHPVTMHPMGKHWLLPEFQNEDWLDIIGYQSGHGVDKEDLRWLCFGPPSRDWKSKSASPFINLEPNYEEHLAYRIRKPITPHMVRRAAYWSLLISPTAGVSYGTNGIWYWSRRFKEPANHPGIGAAKPWKKSLKQPGAENMRVLKKIFTSTQWWKLTPSPEVLSEQPGLSDVESFIAAAKNEEGSLVLIYTPERQCLKLDLKRLKKPLRASWINPSTGEKIECGVLDVDDAALEPPKPGDWLLMLEKCE